MPANGKVDQIGGDHYQPKTVDGLGHWDYVSIVDVPYLESAATKYLTRWRDKGGVEDLEKAQSYIRKRLFLYRAGSSTRCGQKKYDMLFKHFIKDNDIPPNEAKVIDKVMHWQKPEDLDEALKMIQDIIDQEQGAEPDHGYIDQDQ